MPSNAENKQQIAVASHGGEKTAVLTPCCSAEQHDAPISLSRSLTYEESTLCGGIAIESEHATFRCSHVQEHTKADVCCSTQIPAWFQALKDPQ